MNDRAKPPVSDKDFERWVRRQAAVFPYPPTPDRHKISPDLSRQKSWQLDLSRPAYRLAVTLVVLVAALMAVPSVRAAVLEWIQVGAVRIFLPGEMAGSEPGFEIPSILAPSMLDLAGQTTIAEASERAGFEILLPSFPENLGGPDRVYYQELDGGPAVILLWLDPMDPNRILLSLLQLGPNTFVAKDGFAVTKDGPGAVSELAVGTNKAVWLEGRHLLILYQADETGPVGIEVSANVLLWEEGGITYRLESELEREQAVLIAESLR